MISTSTKNRGHLTVLCAAVLTFGAVGCGGGGGSGSASCTGDSPNEDGGSSDGLIGSAAPDLEATSVMGDGPTEIGEGKGSVLIVDFWATYCDPCKKSFPKYQELVEEFSGDLNVIAVSVDDPEDATEDDLKAFVEATGVEFAIVWDKEQSAARAYSPPKMPTSFVIDRDGVVRHMHAGYESGEEEEIAEEVRALIE